MNQCDDGRTKHGWVDRKKDTVKDRPTDNEQMDKGKKRGQLDGQEDR